MSETRLARFDMARTSLPLVAILRGITPAEAEPAAHALYQAGFRLIEVPLNSPNPFDSITRIRRCLPQDALVGAGTVMRAADVEHLAKIGADLVVMPHADIAVISAAIHMGFICSPGVVTPTEAFAALNAGAHGLKLFPAELVSPNVVKALRAVLPKTTPLFPVGGITPNNMAPYIAAGANGFGLGSALYAPGMSLAQLVSQAGSFVSEWKMLHTG